MGRRQGGVARHKRHKRARSSRTTPRRRTARTLCKCHHENVCNVYHLYSAARAVRSRRLLPPRGRRAFARCAPRLPPRCRRVHRCCRAAARVRAPRLPLEGWCRATARRACARTRTAVAAPRRARRRRRRAAPPSPHEWCARAAPRRAAPCCCCTHAHAAPAAWCRVAAPPRRALVIMSQVDEDEVG